MAKGTDTPIYQANLGCRACGLREGCKQPVPGVGPLDARIMFIGESPGENEDKIGLPFQGRAGQYLDYLLSGIGVDRDKVWITNLVHCHPPDNRDPLPDEVDTCAHYWLDTEISIVKPDIIVTLGLFASRYIIGDSTLTMDKNHGIPRVVDGRIILPVYHPAAGLHDPRNMAFVQQDFGALERLLKTGDIDTLIPKDQYPNPDYREVSSAKEAEELLSQPLFALDTETIKGPVGEDRVWSVQVSSKVGTGWFIPVSVWGKGESLVSLDEVVRIPESSRVIAHNYLYDAQFITIPNPIDSMVAAYLLQLPMGLKELAYRYCGMEMHNYREYVRPYQHKKSLGYLCRLAACMAEVTVPANAKAKNPKKFKRVVVGWPDPTGIVDIKWDNDKGELVERERKPHNINTKILERIRAGMGLGMGVGSNIDTDRDIDLLASWRDIDIRERQLVERIMGPMPIADLRDTVYNQAMFYSTRDPDATLRVWGVLEPMLVGAGLMDIFNVEMGHKC